MDDFVDGWIRYRNGCQSVGALVTYHIGFEKEVL